MSSFLSESAPEHVTMYVWRSFEPNEGKLIRCEVGSNGLHDSMFYYRWLAQEKREISGTEVYAFHGLQYPREYVGEDVLEVVDVPYQVDCEDGHEQLGAWNRRVVRWGKSAPSWAEFVASTAFMHA